MSSSRDRSRWPRSFEDYRDFPQKSPRGGVATASRYGAAQPIPARPPLSPREIRRLIGLVFRLAAVALVVTVTTGAIVWATWMGMRGG